MQFLDIAKEIYPEILMLSKGCKNMQFCPVYSKKMVPTGMPKRVICLHSSKNEMAYVVIMSLSPCIFFNPHILIKLLRNSAALHHFLFQRGVQRCYYVGKREVGNTFPKWNVGLSTRVM